MFLSAEIYFVFLLLSALPLYGTTSNGELICEVKGINISMHSKTKKFEIIAK